VGAVSDVLSFVDGARYLLLKLVSLSLLRDAHVLCVNRSGSVSLLSISLRNRVPTLHLSLLDSFSFELVSLPLFLRTSLLEGNVVGLFLAEAVGKLSFL